MNSVAYYPAGSFWHTRDPRLKLLVVIAGATLVVTEKNLGGQFFLLVLHLLLFFTGQLPLRRGWEMVKSFRWLLIIALLLNLWAGSPRTALCYLLRLINLLLMSSWLLGVTESLTLIKGLELTLLPFQRYLPVGEIAMVFGLTLSFFPLLMREAGEIMLAQQARGVNFKTNWAKKMKGLIAMVVPLFISALRRALEIAQAMEARGYVPGAPRGSLYELAWGQKDTVGALFVLCFVLLWWGCKLIWVF